MNIPSIWNPAMKRQSNLLFAILLALPFLPCLAQGYNTERTSFTRFLVRMYNNAPFEGVRIVQDYDSTYLMSVLSLDPAKYSGNESAMNRVASVKAMSQASRFLNGSSSTDDLVIRTTEDSAAGHTTTEIVESVREHSAGYVQALEQLTNFRDANGRQSLSSSAENRSNGIWRSGGL